MSRDLIERLRKFIATKGLMLPASEFEMLALVANELDRIAALEAEASEGERRGLERGVAVASSWERLTPTERQSVRAQFGWTERDFEVAVNVAKGIADTIRALIPEAPAQPELASAAANQISTTEVGLQEASREGELEAAAKAIFEQKGLHLSTGKAWERAIRADRYYCLQYAEAVLIAIGRLPPPPSQDREG